LKLKALKNKDGWKKEDLKILHCVIMRNKCKFAQTKAISVNKRFLQQHNWKV
jgi:hypothetical protein